MTASYQENTTLQSRTANITVGGSGLTPVAVQVIQEAGPVGINTTDNPGLTVFPNPTSGLVRVKFSNLDIQDGFIEIVNTLGVTLMNRKTESTDMQLDLSAIANGVYLLVFRNNKIIISEKIVIKQNGS